MWRTKGNRCWTIGPIAILFAILSPWHESNADDGEALPVAIDPAQSRGAQYLAVRNEIDRQQKALRSRFLAACAVVDIEIDRRRQTLYASTEDDIEREEWGALLDELRGDAVLELQGEFGGYRRRLDDLRRAATGEINRDGVLSEPTWASVSRFADARSFPTPDVLRTADKPDLRPMYSGFAAAIYDCTVYESTFTHPDTRDQLKRRVAGVVDGRCLYEEEMPAGGLKTCHYSLERLETLADYYADPAAHERLRFTSRNAFVGGRAVTINTWTLDGEPFDHPLDAAMTAGECAVSGY